MGVRFIGSFHAQVLVGWDDIEGTTNTLHAARAHACLYDDAWLILFETTSWVITGWPGVGRITMPQRHLGMSPLGVWIEGPAVIQNGEVYD